MSSSLNNTELRKMPVEDLLREVRVRKLALAKGAIGVQLGSQKDTSTLKKERRAIARMLTIAGEQKQKAGLKEDVATPTIPARRPAKRGTKKSISSSAA